jgi:hypothetical protein
MTRFTLYVPELYNNGHPVPPSELERLEDELVRVAGGFTCTRALGAWGTYREPMRLYAVDSDDPDVPGKLHKLASAVAARFDQEAVYLTHETLGVTLVKP